MTLPLLTAAFFAAAAPATSAPVVQGHGVRVVGPDGWKRSDDGTTAILSAPGQDASLRVDLFDKKDAGQAQDCLSQLLDKLSAGSATERESYALGVVDGQPSASQSRLSDDRKNRERRVVGCNGKSYFLLDWVEVNPPRAKGHEAEFTALLVGIHYTQADKDK